MTQDLTARQEAVLSFVRDFSARNGYPPTVRETCTGTGLSSPSSVKYHFDALEKKGYLTRDPRRPRTLMLTEEAISEPEASVSELHPEWIDSDRAVDVPLVGTIAAGAPILADQHIDDVFVLPRQMTGTGELFMLKVSGESMIDAGILDGDWVVVRRQPVAERGEIVAALIDDEATVKTFDKRDGHIWLLPQNRDYQPIPGDQARILGRVVTVLRAL